MVKVLLQSLAIAVTGLFSFGSISIVLLLLLSKSKGSKGLSYSLGYTFSYILLGILLVNIGSSFFNMETLLNNHIFKAIVVVLGLFLLFIGLRNIQSKKNKSGNKSILTRIDNISNIRCFCLGLIIPIINFKNLILYSSAIAIIALSSLYIQKKIIISVIVSVVFSFSVSIPVIIYFLFPTRSGIILSRIKSYINRYKRAVSIILPIVIGSLLIVRGGFM